MHSTRRLLQTASHMAKQIAVGDKFPNGITCHNISSLGDPTKNVCQRIGANKAEAVNLDDYIKGKKVVIFSIPGAFTPTCSISHLPGFVEKSDEIKKHGVSKIAMTAVNDPFVLRAMSDLLDPSQKVDNLADGNGSLAKALGMELDLTGAGLGVRGKRYAMIVDDGTVKYLGVDDKGLDKSSAEAVLEALNKGA